MFHKTLPEAGECYCWIITTFNLINHLYIFLLLFTPNSAECLPYFTNTVG